MDGRNISRTGLLIAFLFAAVVFLPMSEEASSRLGASFTVFPIYGNVYPKGLFYVEMNIGNPPKPYFLDIDTGSDLTWVQCDAPCTSCSKGPHALYKPKKSNLVDCRQPLCVALHSGAPPNPKCTQCDYEIGYFDGGSSLGVLVADAFALRLGNTTTVQPVLGFGCGYDQQFASQNVAEATDGVLGLGTGKVGILSQLRDQGVTKDVVFAHCLSSEGGGFLLFGANSVIDPRITWRPMFRIPSTNYYSPGPANLYWGNQFLGGRQMQVVLDTGSTYTYFEPQPYQALLSAVRKDLLHKPLKEFEDRNHACWKGSKPFKSVNEVKGFFKQLALSFVQGKTLPFVILPENYLFVREDGNVCLGILDGSRFRLPNLNLIGAISLQDLVVIYDNDKRQIGWARSTACKAKYQASTSSP